MDLAAEESVQILNFTSNPKSAKRDRTPKPSATPLDKAYSSASPLDVASTDCDFDQLFIMAPAQMIIPPEVDFLVLLSPAQSLSA